MNALAHGTLLGGRYRVVRMIGRGGMGVVYEAVQEGLARKVAVKLLLGGDALGVERFRREAQASAALGHPHIVQVTDFQTPPGEAPFLVMELLDGTSLGALIDRDGPMAVGRVAGIVSQVLDALEAAHAAGIVHRDIKPDNVFLVRTAASPDFVKVLDFGVAKVEAPDAAPITRVGQVIGSPAYMAPEQARGLPVDQRTDVFGVGRTMHHALTGRVPDEATGLATSAAPRSFSMVAPLTVARPDLPPAFVSIVERATAADPSARFASAAEMRSALAPWLSTGAPLPPPPTPGRSEPIMTTAAFAPTMPGAQQQRSTLVTQPAPSAATQLAAPFTLRPATSLTPPRATAPASGARWALLAVGVLVALGAVVGVAFAFRLGDARVALSDSVTITPPSATIDATASAPPALGSAEPPIVAPSPTAHDPPSPPAVPIGLRPVPSAPTPPRVLADPLAHDAGAPPPPPLKVPYTVTLTPLIRPTGTDLTAADAHVILSARAPVVADCYASYGGGLPKRFTMRVTLAGTGKVIQLTPLTALSGLVNCTVGAMAMMQFRVRQPPPATISFDVTVDGTPKATRR